MPEMSDHADADADAHHQAYHEDEDRDNDVDKGLSTYDVSQFQGFSDPPSPPRHQSSAIA